MARPDRRWQRARASILGAVLLAVPAAGQTFGDVAPGPARLSGTVVDARDGSPLEGATVTIFDFDRAASARRLSDARGAFAFDGIATGTYRVHVRHTGFVEQIYGSDFPVGTAEHRLVLGPDAPRVEVRFALQPSATVRGRVTDDGHPVAGALVLVGRLDTHLASSSVAGVAPAATTGVDGRYEVTGLPAGDWHVETYAAGTAARTPEGDRAAFARTFYPGVTQPAIAVPVHVEAGAVVDDVHIALSRARFVSLALRVDPALARPGRYLEIVVASIPPGTKFAFDHRAVLEDGSVHVFRLTPGRYVAWVRATSGSTRQAGWTIVDVTGEQPAITLDLEPTGRIEGRVVTVDGTALPSDGIRVIAALVPDGQDPDPLSPDSVEVGAQGRFAIGALFGPRRLRVIGLPARWRVLEVRRGGRAVGDPLRVGTGETVGGIEIVLERAPGADR
ncbi:MAG: collagen binding domain-containing protein [Vicinamibacterales bacterium]